MQRKGIILAGGSGTRLYPTTIHISKQLLPIHDKPMIYYPLSILMNIGIKEILIISTPRDLPMFKKLIQINRLGLKISFITQRKPNGLAEALILGKNFLKGSPCALILGDNIFYGKNLFQYLNMGLTKDGATIFTIKVNNPKDYGVIEINKKNKIKKIVEKPTYPKSNLAVTGIYFYDKNASLYAEKLKPSNRGELEITDLNNIYLKKNKLNFIVLGKNTFWHDAGDHHRLTDLHSTIRSYELKNNTKIGCIEEIALKKGYISKKKFQKQKNLEINNEYYRYLKKIAYE